MARRTQGRRRALGALTAVVVALPLVLGAAPAQALPDPSAGSAAAPAALRAKAENVVRAQLAAKDKTTFWIALSDEADTTAASAQRHRTAKTRTLHQVKQAHAKKSQKSLKALLDRSGARYESFWITNTIKVTADAKLAEKIAARTDVAALEADEPIRMPRPATVTARTKAQSVGWNIDRINAPKVWSELGVRGEGIVVASMDSGVSHTHPALQSKYRGYRADGTFDHDYNWFDPTMGCTPRTPCDTSGYGTHAVGTMVGDDTTANHTGVAPGAKWIAAKGCGETCARSHLLRAAEWMVAPTDSTGGNPRPELAPHVVSIAWGSRGHDPWFKTVAQAWRAAGIFPAIASGDEGPGCNTSGSPGDHSTSFSSGAFDSTNTVATSSSRGSGDNGETKPNLVAPGVDIVSAWPGGRYLSLSSTAMASPHTVATVALMWSAAPALRGNVAETEKLLSATAIDVDDTSCGGTPAHNNVAGEGRLDAYAAVLASPRGPVGTVSGQVSSGSSPLAGATLRFAGPSNTTTVSDAAGNYTSPKLMVGTYTVTAGKYGYENAVATVTITENGGAAEDFTLTEATFGDLTGKISSHAGGEEKATVKVQGTPVSATTAADGTYALRLPLGTYDITATPNHRCAGVTSARVTVTANTTRAITLPDRTDAFGTACTATTGAPFPQGTTKLSYPGIESGSTTVDLPFPVPFYGRTHRKATVFQSGALGFTTTNPATRAAPLVGGNGPNGSLHPFWENLRYDAEAGVYWTATGTAPHRRLVVEWRNALLYDSFGGPAQRLSFAAVVGEDGTSSFHYKDSNGTGRENGSRASVGIKNATGTDALIYSFNEGTIRDGLGIHFRPTKSSVITGTVTDANDRKPVVGATVTASSGSTDSGGDTTDARGDYLVHVAAPAAHDIAVTAPEYTARKTSTTPAPGDAVLVNYALTTGRVTADTPSLTTVVPTGERRSRTLDLANTGSATAYTVAEKDGKSWLTATPASGQLGAGGRQTLTVTADTAGVAPGTVLTGTLRVTSQSARQPVIDIPVSVVVPTYRTAVDIGATRGLTDRSGDAWSPDRAYAAGSYGHLGTSTRSSTARAITGVSASSDPTLYRSARQGMSEYRFDGVPNGTYRVELGFAQLTNQRPASRVFDVTAEGTQVVSNLDLALEAGVRRAHDRAFTVQVTDGQLNLRFTPTVGKALVNSIRVTERPDLTG